MRIPLGMDHLSFEYLDPDDENAVAAALKYVQSHQGQIPVADLEHLGQTLELLTSWKMPAQPVLAFLAHYLMKHGISLPQEPGRPFSDEVLELGRKFGELDRPPAVFKDPEHLTKAYRTDRLRHLFVTAYTHLELALLCLAAHVVRMHSIKLLDYREARLLAEDNEAIFLPLLEMLGMWQLRRELGDLSLEVLNPKKVWEKIRRQQERVHGEQYRYYLRIRGVLARELNRAGIKDDIRPHVSPPSSIYRRMVRGEALQELVRQTKVDILVATEEECYQVLRLIHSQWPPMVGRTRVGGYFQDLIAASKFNGYRALITTVGYPKSENPEVRVPIEFRIRTHEMERTNALGVIAARFLSTPPLSIKGAWWEDQRKRSLVCAHPLGSSSDKIYVFTPAGDVYIFPKDSTPIDFAYHVHSEVGHHCRHIWVNGRSASYAQKLRNGDLVEIETDSRYPGPDEKWLSVVRPPPATLRGRRALKQRQKTAKGREIIDNLLQKELEAYGLPEIPEEEIERFLEATARYFNYPDLRALYLDIADPRRSPGSRKPPSPNRIVACLIASHLADHIAKANGEPVGIPKHRIKFAQCRHNGELCRVTSGSEIVGRIVNQGTPHERLIVYRRDCPTAAKVGADIPLMWLGDRRPGKPVRVLIETVDRPRLLDDVLHTVYDLYDEGLYLLEVQAKVTRDRAAHISLTIDAPSYDAVTRLSEALHQLKEHGILDEEPRIDALSPIEKMLLAEPDTLPNPYTTGPVRDRRVFKGRDAELQQIVSCVRGDQNLVVLYGINRIGKTSLLRYLHAHVAEEYDLVPILLDMPFLTKNEEAQFWLEIAAKVEEAVAHLYKGTAGRFKRLRKKNGDDTFVHFRDWLAKAQSLLKGRKLLIMIDEWNVLDELWDRDAALLLIYRLKSLVEGHPDLAFVLCVQETLYKKAASDATKVPSWPLLRAGLPVRLGYLRRPAAERLIREPIGQMLQYDAAVVEEILYLTACHPYYLQNVLLLLIHHINQMRMSGQKGGIPRVTYEDLDTVIPQLLDSGEHLFNDFLRECRGFKGTVLCALAHVSQERHRGATAEELQTVLQQQGYRVQPSSLARNLRMLCEAGILERRQQRGQLRYRIRVPLFERWLLENRPLSPKAR